MDMKNHENAKEYGKIAIVTQNRELASFVRIEAAFERIGAEYFEKNSAVGQIESYDAVFWDCDTVSPPADLAFDGILISVSESEPAMAADLRLPFPFSVHELHRIFWKIRERDIAGENTTAREPETAETLVLHCTSRGAVMCSGGKSVHLTQYERDILCLLGKETGKLVPREELRAALQANDGNISDVYICRIRRKAERITAKKLIETVRGKGYRLLVEIAVENAEE